VHATERTIESGSIERGGRDIGYCGEGAS